MLSVKYNKIWLTDNDPIFSHGLLPVGGEITDTLWSLVLAPDFTENEDKKMRLTCMFVKLAPNI